MGEDEIYRSWFKKYVSCEDSLEGNILFSKLFQNLQVRSCTEAIAETVGSIMNQHLGTNRYCFPDLCCNFVFGIKFLLKITTGIWHQSTSARSWFYSWTTDVLLHVYCVCDRSRYVWEWTHETLHIIISFQHALEPLVDRVCAVQQDKEFLYKRDSQGKLVTRHRRLADPSHGTAIKSFRKTEQLKSKLPQAFWAKSWKKNLYLVCCMKTVCSMLYGGLLPNIYFKDVQ